MAKPEPLLSARNLSKTYALWDSPLDRLVSIFLDGAGHGMRFLPGLRNYFSNRALKKARLVEALKPLDFDVMPGESLGIVGRNGSGKSTLLQLIAGTLHPTTGNVVRNGRITALLELGSGFNLEFTGRENVRMQASIYGFTDEEINAKMDEVERFAEIGDFIDQPAKAYSSGMLVRLAFAVHTVMDPQIFIVDEALAVGDVFFQSRCTRWFRRKLEEGMSLILVSHDLPSVKALCANAIVLDKGRCAFQGPSDQAISAYHELHQAVESSAKTTPRPPKRDPQPSDTDLPPAGNWQSSDEIGTREASITHCFVLDKLGRKTSSFLVGEPVVIRIRVEASIDVEEAHIAFQIVDRHARAIYGYHSRTDSDLTNGLSKGETGWFEIILPGVFGGGDFLLDAGVSMGDRGDGAPEYQYHRVGGIAQFSVRHAGMRPAFHGVANFQAKVSWHATNPANVQ